MLRSRKTALATKGEGCAQEPSLAVHPFTHSLVHSFMHRQSAPVGAAEPSPRGGCHLVVPCPELDSITHLLQAGPPLYTRGKLRLGEGGAGLRSPRRTFSVTAQDTAPRRPRWAPPGSKLVAPAPPCPTGTLSQPLMNSHRAGLAPLRKSAR